MNENRFSSHLSNGQAAVADNGARSPSPPGRGVRGEGPGNGTPHPNDAAHTAAPPDDKTRRADARAPASDAAAPADTGRDQSGRFAKGNPGGPGNPFAREVARLRRAFMNRVSLKDFEDIVDKMVALA
jgi:hypothetical protein